MVEAPVVLVLSDERPGVAVLGLALGQVRDDIASDAARVVSEAVAVRHHARECGRYGSQVLRAGKS